jgi:hypothetical protein
MDKQNSVNNKKKTIKKYITKINQINENNEYDDKNINSVNNKDYYDNYNFVPKGQIHPRLENSFLFSDEINKLKNEIYFDKNNLLKDIEEIKKEAENASKERQKVINELKSLQIQLNEIKKQNAERKEEDIDEDNDNNLKKLIKDNDYDNKILKYKDNDDYHYIGKDFFERYENELPNISPIEKEKNFFEIKKKYMDENQMELENLIEKSNDILENLKNNEKAEKELQKKPEDYFNTSDHFFHTYRLNHTNDYDEYANKYKSNIDYLMKKYKIKNDDDENDEEDNDNYLN